MINFSKRQLRSRNGVIFANMAVALVALVGMVGFAIDIGLLALGAQQCQEIADAAALAGSQELPNQTVAGATARDVAAPNYPAIEVSKFTLNTNYYTTGQSIPNVGNAPVGGAMQVTVGKRVDYAFLRILGLNGTTVQRTSIAGKIVTGTCIAPMWIWETTPVSYGVAINLLMASAPHSGIPGNFGFLQPPAGANFIDALSGNLTPEEEELFRTYPGSYVYGNTGLAVGQFTGALINDYDSRLKRGTRYPFNSDTFTSFHADNPRIMLVPFVHYVDGTGSNARFTITKFGAFWLEDVITKGSDRTIKGRFIDFTRPGGTGSGIKPSHLLR